MRVLSAILLSLSLASYAAADDADVLRLLIKIREQSSEVSTVPCDAQASQMAKCPCGCPDCKCGTGEPCDCSCENCTCVKKLAVLQPKPKAPPQQYRTVTYPAEYRTVEYTQKVCHGRGRPCTYEKHSYQQLVRPERTVQVPIELPEPAATDLPADQQPTPMSAVGAGLRALNPQPGEVLVDYGCGFDARWLITAVRLYGTQQAVGIEIDPEVAESARRYVEKAGYSDRIRIITADSTKYRPYAAIGVAYLWPETLEKLKPQIQNLRRFVSFGHAVPDLNMRQVGDLFIYERPVPQAVQRQPVMLQRPQAAVWNGRLYSHPVCSNPRCSMCNAIRSQLYSWN